MAATKLVQHAINEFACSVGFMDELSEKPTDVGKLVKGLVEELQEQSRAKAHPLVWANLAFLAGCIFSCGVLWNKVATLEVKAQSVDAIQILAVKVENMQSEFGRIRDRIDQILDQNAAAKRQQH